MSKAAQNPSAYKDESLIRIRGLVNRFGSQTVHDGLDLDIRRGEILGVVGASGSGKSVMVQSILGLHHPNEGQIEFEGVDLLKLSREEMLSYFNRWAVLFQKGALFSNLTVIENVFLPMVEHYNIKEDLARELAAMKLKMAGLKEEAFEKAPSELSGGMIKRAALARALALDPSILFLDEPTAGLDPISAAAFDELILSLRESLGVTVVLVTHDIDSLVRICDRIAVIVDKRIVVDTLEGLRKHEHPWIHEYFHGVRMRAALPDESAGK
ncbi:MAG: ABC transporter ATP-binding protein [Pseudobdellovibrionaceae bacterium]